MAEPEGKKHMTGPINPAADKRLIAREQSPYNAEPPLPDLARGFLTPHESFYVRSHAPVPQIHPAGFRLEVAGLVERPLSLGLDELRRGFPQVTVTATLTCAGNRRSEHSKVRKVGGVAWGAGAIGTAEWTGVPLSAVLRAAGLRDGARHVWFEGLDRVPDGGNTISFGASIPIEKALAEAGSPAGGAVPGALVAFAMNGRDLPPVHGFPLRSLVPGYIGARSVKWLGRVVVSDRPSDNHFVRHDYKLLPEDDPATWAAGAPIDKYAINSVICSPEEGATLRPGRVEVRGYALAPGLPGRRITQVGVSADGGETWTRARVSDAERDFCWQLWHAEVSVTPQTRSLAVRARDSAGETQPRVPEWNVKGYLYSGWHQVAVTVWNA